MLRGATTEDSESIARLLMQLDYDITESEVASKIELSKSLDSMEVIVATDDMNQVLGFVSLHFIPQLGVTGDFARITYFCVDESARTNGVGSALEREVVERARLRNCDRIEVHCHSRRSEAHRFYARHGYTESPKYLTKRTNRAEQAGGRRPPPALSRHEPLDSNTHSSYGVALPAGGGLTLARYLKSQEKSNDHP